MTVEKFSAKLVTKWILRRIKDRKEVDKMLVKIKTRALVAHLRSHAMPEITDNECLSAFDNIKAQYGEMYSYLGGIEVHLGDPARHVDYTLLNKSENIPLPSLLWCELDYEQFSSGKKIEPCYFFSFYSKSDLDTYKKAFDKYLPPFLGEETDKKLREPLIELIKKLPNGVYIRHIGSMASRGNFDTVRLAVFVSERENLCSTLEKIGWTGDIAALWRFIEPLHEQKYISFDFDLGENGISDKIGVEMYVENLQPVIIDRVITALEQKGLCIESKGDAIRRWIRIPPDDDPRIRTSIEHFKINFLGDRIIKAKAYLKQQPYLNRNNSSKKN